VVIFIIQNPHAMNISFLDVHLVLPQAMALFMAALAGALLTAAAGTARITQLRRIMRRDPRKPPAG
jgi:lipopolysaccharide assembly protein A